MDSGSEFIHSNQCATLKQWLVLSKYFHQPVPQTPRHNVLRTDLNDARSLSACSRQQSPKVKVMSKDNVIVPTRPVHNDLIRRAGISFG